MIGIQLEGNDDFLELDPGSSISLRLENPLFGDADKLSPGSFTLPFDIPSGDVSKKNSARLKNPDVMENNEVYEVQKASLFISESPADLPVPFKQGTLKSGTSKNGKTSSNFLFGLNTISPDFKTARLRDVISEEIVMNADSIVKRIFIKYTGSGDPTLTVNGKAYFGVDLGAIRTMIQDDFIVTLDTFKYVPRAEYHLSGASPGGLAAPYLEIRMALYYTFHDDFLDMDFWLEQNSVDPLVELSVLTDDENPGDYQVESFDMTDYYDGIDEFLADYYTGPGYPNNKIRFPICFNANSYGENIKDGELINGVNAGGMIRNDPSFANWSVKNVNSVQPFVLMKYLLDKVAQRFGFLLEGDFYSHADTAGILIWNTASLDVPQNYIGTKKFVFCRRSFNINELVPDVSVVDFLKALSSRYNLGIYYNEATRKVRMKIRENVARDPYSDDITAMCGKVTQDGDARLTGHTLRVKKETTDAFSIDESFVYGDGAQEVPVKAGRLHQSSGAFLEAEKYAVGPRVSQKNGDDFSIRLFHYHGLVDMGTFKYPSAAVDGTINESLSAIADEFWLYWLLFSRNRRTLTLPIAYPLRLLMEYNWERKKMFDRSRYLVKSLDLKITNTGLEVTSAEIYTMR